MATLKLEADPAERYHAALAYIRRALTATEASWWNALEWRASELKQAPFKAELAKLQARFASKLDAKTLETVARDAELLADRTKETLPGAPPDWKRTNLYTGEVEKQTAATSFFGEVVGGNDPNDPKRASFNLKRALVVGGAVAGAVILGRMFLGSMADRPRYSRYD